MESLENRIVATPDTLFGKPRIKGTRIGVEFILDLVSSGWSEDRILEEYPHVTREDLRAVLVHAALAAKEA